MSNVEIKYDPQVNILRIRLGDQPIEQSDEVQPGVIVDYDANGNIVGLEILDVSDILTASEIGVAKTTIPAEQ
jgi:uncharacterized protein YuzE